MDKLRKTLMSAVGLSILLVCLLTAMIRSAGIETKSDFELNRQVVIALLLTVGAIVQWVRYLKGYIDFAIERKLKETDKQEPD